MTLSCRIVRDLPLKILWLALCAALCAACAATTPSAAAPSPVAPTRAAKPQDVPPALAALAQRPRLLLLDEPTDGLDPVVRREILDILLTEIRERNVSVLVSSHLVHELQGLCTRIAIVDAGRLVATSTLEELGASGMGAGPLALEDAYVRTLREARAAGRGAA